MRPLILVEAKLTATRGRNIHGCYRDRRKAKHEQRLTSRDTGRHVRRRIYFILHQKKFLVFYPNRVLKHKISDTIFYLYLICSKFEVGSLVQFCAKGEISAGSNSDFVVETNSCEDS